MKGRSARPDEIPRYGSVWTWGTGGVLRMALALTEEPPYRVLITYVVVSTPNGRSIGTIGKMLWRDPRNTVMNSWVCVDEGPE